MPYTADQNAQLQALRAEYWGTAANPGLIPQENKRHLDALNQLQEQWKQERLAVLVGYKGEPDVASPGATQNP